jgi:excisionase family DNA binding protein
MKDISHRDEVRVLTATQAASILGVSRRTILRRIATGGLPGHKLPGRTGAWLLNPAVLDEQETT